MTDFFVRYHSDLLCQASAAVSADSFSGGAKTQINLVSAGNADGAHALQFEMDVTATSGTPYGEIWCEPLQYDGVGNGRPFMAARFKNAIDAVDKYVAEMIDNIPLNANYIIRTVDVGFTASLRVRGKYISDA